MIATGKLGIGEIFDAVHPEGATQAVHNLQTTLIPPGGAAWLELTIDVPGEYLFIDHAISRAIDKGALGEMHVTGPGSPGVFCSGTSANVPRAMESGLRLQSGPRRLAIHDIAAMRMPSNTIGTPLEHVHPASDRDVGSSPP